MMLRRIRRKPSFVRSMGTIDRSINQVARKERKAGEVKSNTTWARITYILT